MKKDKINIAIHLNGEQQYEYIERLINEAKILGKQEALADVLDILNGYNLVLTGKEKNLIWAIKRDIRKLKER